MTTQIYAGRGREHNRWRWRIVARNGRIVAVSGEAFYNRATARRALTKFVQAVKKG